MLKNAISILAGWKFLKENTLGDIKIGTNMHMSFFLVKIP